MTDRTVEPALRAGAAVRSDAADRGASRVPALVYRVGPILLAIAAVPMYVRLSWTMFVNADDSNAILQGADVAHGNLLLHGWTLSGSPFYLIEMPVFALVAAVRGVTPAVAHEAGSIVYVLFLALTGLLAAHGLARRAGRLAAAAAVALLMAPAAFIIRFLLLGPYHVGTAAAITGSLLAIGKLGGRRRDLVVFLVLTAASVSDPLTVWVGTGGIAITLGLRILRSRQTAEAPLLIAVAGSAVAAQAVIYGIRAVGGFTTLPLPATLASPGDLLRNVGIAVDGLRLLYSAEGSTVPMAGAFIDLHLLFLVAAVAGVVWALGRAVSGRADVTLQMAVVIIGLDVAATIGSGQTVDIGSLRYLMPAYGLIAAVAGRLAGPLLARRGAWVAAAAVVAVQVGFLASFDLQQPVNPYPRLALERFLLAHNLNHGLAQYWDSSSITVETNGHVTVRAVVSGGGFVSPYHWESNAAWYRPRADGPATFVLEPLAGGGPDQASLVHAFGPPAQQVQYAGYRIEIWNRDLDPLLSGA